MLVADIIRLNARARPRAVGIVARGEDHTWVDLERCTTLVADALSTAGVARGARVAVLAKNSLEYLWLYFATAKIGAILVPLNFWHRSAEHRYTLADATPTLLFVEPTYLDVAAPAVAGIAADLPVITLPDEEGRPSPGWEAFLTAGRAAGAQPEAAVEPSDPHMILYTSGTTGTPKGAVLTHERTVADALSMSGALGIRQSDVYLNYFPPFHVGNWDHMKLFLLAGAKVVLLPSFDAGEVLAHIAEHAVTVVLGVPTMLHALLEHPRFAATDTSSVRLIYYGAYDPSGIMERTADAFGARQGHTQMAHTYGLTEGGCFVTLCQPEDVFDHWGSIGRPIPGVEVALLDDDLREVDPGAAGEICVRGPRMSGYWGRPGDTAEALAGGWLHTGDIATSDPDGFLRIVDRKKDMIRSGGQNVYSKQVEDCLGAHPRVAEAAIIGLPDPVYEEQVCAVVVATGPVGDHRSLADELSTWVRERLAGYNTPRRYEFVAEMPKTAVGKTQKHVLRERYR